MATESKKSKLTIIKKSLALKLLEVVREVGSSSTIVGVPQLARQDYIVIKIIWIVGLIGSSSLCGILSIQMLQQYLSFDTITSIDRINDYPAELPTITFCNYNPFHTVEDIEYSKKLVLKKFGLSIDEMRQNNIFNSDFVLMSILRYLVGSNFLNNIKHNPLNLSQIETKLNNIVLSCNYNMLPCPKDMFSWRYDSFYGDCFSFNSGTNLAGEKVKTLTSTRAGPLNGMILELAVDYIDNIYGFSMANGLHVFIHNKSTRVTMYDGYNVPVGTYYEMGFARELTEKLPTPYSDCIQAEDIQNYDSEITRFMVNSSIKYTQSACINILSQKFVALNCSCQDINTEMLPSYTKRPCLEPNDLVCLFTVISQFFSLNVEALVAKDCPKECMQVSYELTTTSQNYPSKAYYDSMLSKRLAMTIQANKSYEEIKSKLMVLNAFYNTLDINHIYESPQMSFIDLLSGFGGFLGLFIGVSMLSFVEFIELIVKLVIVVFKSI